MTNKTRKYEGYFIQIQAPEPPRLPPINPEDLKDKEEDKQERIVEMQI